MTSDSLRILVIEDNLALRLSMAALFESQGMRADFAADGRVGLQLALADPPDVLVLDVMLPGLDGLRVCERLRAQSDRHIPILMLTARDALDDKIRGFDAGADDYLVKPFADRELLVRCVALSRRHRVGEANLITVGALRIDRRTGLVERDGCPIELHQTSYRILLALAEAWPRTLSRSELIDRLWGEDPPPSDPLRTHLYLLRQALDKPFAHAMLHTAHGVGFKLVAES